MIFSFIPRAVRKTYRIRLIRLMEINRSRAKVKVGGKEGGRGEMEKGRLNQITK